MIKVWTGKPLNFSYLPLLYPNWGIQVKDSNLFFSKKVFANFKEPFVSMTDDPALADFLLIPHNLPLIRDKKDYLDNFVVLAKKHNKKIIVFVYGDSDEKIKLPNAIVFRTHCYASEKRNNEIIMPPFVEDLAEEFIFKLREKISDKPVIGFCGWTSASGLKVRVVAFVKKILWFAKGQGVIGADGLALRKKAIKILNRSKIVQTNFIERKTYSGHASTISLSPEKARKEYIENMSDTDLALIVRGKGNFSFRFYEALSAGRVPVFINTDCALPFNDKIKYGDFVFFIDYKKINKIDVLISQFYKNLNNKSFILMQKKAKEAFANYLKIDKFFELMFLKEEIKKLQ